MKNYNRREIGALFGNIAIIAFMVWLTIPKIDTVNHPPLTDHRDMATHHEKEGDPSKQVLGAKAESEILYKVDPHTSRYVLK